MDFTTITTAISSAVGDVQPVLLTVAGSGIALGLFIWGIRKAYAVFKGVAK